MFMSTHTLEVAEELCDRIGIIQKGELLAEGTVTELKELAGQEDSRLESIFLHLTGAETESTEDIGFINQKNSSIPQSVNSGYESIDFACPTLVGFQKRLILWRPPIPYQSRFSCWPWLLASGSEYM